MASTLEELMQSLRSDSRGDVGELSPALMKALETYSRSYNATMTAMQTAYDRGMSGLEKRLGEMAAAYEATAVANSDDARALIRELLTSQKMANDQQAALNAQWRKMAESYFPQVTKEQLMAEILKRKEAQKRLELLKQELGLDKERWEIAKEQRREAVRPTTQKLDTELGLLDRFKGLGRDPVVGNLVDAVKGIVQGRKDTVNKALEKDLADMDREYELRKGAFDAMSREREQNIGAFTQTAQRAFQGLTTDREGRRGNRPPIAQRAPEPAYTEPPVAQRSAPEPPIATRAAPETAIPSEPPVARKMSEQAADEAINRVMSAQPQLDTGITAPVKTTAPTRNVATGPLGGKGGYVSLGGIGNALGGLGSAMSEALTKGLSSLGNVLFKTLGPLGWLASIGQSVNSVLPIFSSTFGTLYDVLRMAGPFLTSLAIEGVTTLLTGINGIATIIDEFVHLFRGDSMREKAEKSGAMAKARANAQAEKQMQDTALEQSRRGFTLFNPMESAVGVTAVRTLAPVLSRNESSLTTPSEERAMAESAPPTLPASAPQDQSALINALNRISAPQNPGTTAILPSSPYLQTFAV